MVIASKARSGLIPLRLAYVGAPRWQVSHNYTEGGSAQRFPRSLLKAFGLRMPWGVMIPVINSGGVTSKPGLRAVLVGLAIRT